MPQPCQTRDSVLVRRALAREPGGATRIHGRYRRYVGGIVSRFVGDPEMVGELSQEAFLKAFRYLGSLREQSRLSIWLARIARSVALDFRASRRSRPAEVPVLPELFLAEVPDPGPDPEERSLAGQARGLVEELPEPFRTTLLARFMDDLPIAEVARRQAIDVPLAKYRIRRGLDLLRQRLVSMEPQR